MKSPQFRALLLLLLLLSTPSTFAQGTRADYERAFKLRKETEGKVFYAGIRANWLSDGKQFWYRADGPGGRRSFVLVDPAKPEKRPAFDHKRLADALTNMLGKQVEPERLPVEAIAFPSEGRMLVQTGLKTFACDLNTYTLTETTEPVAQIRALGPSQIQPSRNMGDETVITFANRTMKPVHLFWLDTEGKTKQYGTLPPGELKQQHTYAGHTWLAVTESGEVLAAFVATDLPGLAAIEGKGDASKAADAPARDVPGRSPNGALQVTFKDFNAILRDTATNQETPLTTDGKADDFYGKATYWSPDSTKVVVMKTIPEQEHKVYMVESSPTDQVQPKLRTIDYLKPGDKVEHPRPHLFDVASRREIPIAEDLFSNPWEISDIRWDADGKRFTFIYNQRGHQVFRLISVDAETGQAKTLIDETSKTFVCYSSKAYWEILDKSREVIWMSERDGWCHLYLFDSKTGALKNQITKGEWVVRQVDKVDPEKRQIWFRAGGIRPGQDPYYVHYCRVNFDGTGLTILTEGDGTHDVAVSPNGEYLVDFWSRVDLPLVTELRRSSDGKKVLDLEKGDASALLRTGWKYPERFVAKGRDGKTDIYGVIWRPMNFDPKKKYPIIEQIYAGPQDSYVPKRFAAYYNTQSLAELGFIVVQMDGMGTSNRSKAFHDVCWQNLADAGFPDRILWIKAAAAKYPYMDLTRIGIYGTSAGGQNALGGLLLHPDFYKAGVADCGCHDNRMDKIWWNEQWMGWPIGPHYAAQSNVTLAPRLEGKLFLIVGEVDSNVDPASTTQVTNALIKANKDFDFLLYPGGGHGILGTEYGYRRMLDFFVRNLYGVEPRSK